MKIFHQVLSLRVVKGIKDVSSTQNLTALTLYINAGLSKGHCQLATCLMMTTFSVVENLLLELLNIMKKRYLKSLLQVIHLFKGWIFFLMFYHGFKF